MGDLVGDLVAMANVERAALLADLEGLTDGQWATLTVCDPWTVRHLVAHMTAVGHQTASNFFRGFLTSGFSFDKFVAMDLVRFDQGSNADVLAGFAKTVGSPKGPPGIATSGPSGLPRSGPRGCRGRRARALSPRPFPSPPTT